MKNEPKVSVICWAYNQEKYIAQTLDSFVMQKTDFAFEVIIHDDASTDMTTEIIREYEKKYPKIIKPIYQKENQFSKATGNFIKLTFQSAKGMYIALCEGDDYWTDENKLQKQVDFLDEHPDYSVCFHPVKIVLEGDRKEESVSPEGSTGFNVSRLLHGNFIRTNSVIYRSRPSYDDLMPIGIPADWYLHLYHAAFGKIGFINEVMSVYRRHQDGMWWDVYKDSANIWRNYGVRHFKMIAEVYKLYSDKPKYEKIVRGALCWAVEETAKQDPEYLQKLLDEVFRDDRYRVITTDTLRSLLVAKAESERSLNEVRALLEKEVNVSKSSLSKRIIRKAAREIKGRVRK